MSVQKFKSTPIQNTTSIEPKYYFAIFDDYLKPKKQQNFNKHRKELLALNGASNKEWTLNQSIREKWRLSVQRFNQQRVVKVKSYNNLQLDTRKASTQPNVGVPKSGFEIYCEMASVHGFNYLVGTTKWQRLFWYFILCLMLSLSIFTLWNSLSLYADTPTILHMETKTGLLWGRSFPTVTLCNFNRISKKKLNELLRRDFSPEVANQIRPFIPYILYSSLPVNATPATYRYLDTILRSKNYTHSEFLQKISPDCENQLISCQIHGQLQPCKSLFRRVETQHGYCCAFNYDAVINGNQTAAELSAHSNRFGYKWGLSALLDPQVGDYYAARNKFAGYQIYTRHSTDFVAINQPHHMIFPGNEIHMHITPAITLATTFVRWHALHLRRCYFAKERKLLTFANYTQQNCFAECRSRSMLKLCGCVPPLWPRAQNWTACSLVQASCVMAHIDSISGIVHPSGKDYKISLSAERFNCKCYPECEFSMYKVDYDSMPLDRRYSINDLEFYRGISLKNHLVVHAFHADKTNDYMRLDVRYQWLNYFGLFGGITGLYMGYSFISGFEVVFFLLVRPLANLMARINERRQVTGKQEKSKKKKKKKNHLYINN